MKWFNHNPINKSNVLKNALLQRLSYFISIVRNAGTWGVFSPLFFTVLQECHSLHIIFWETLSGRGAKVLNFIFFKDRHQILLLILSEFKWINFYSSWKHQETFGFMMISGRAEVNWFVWIRLILEAKIRR